MSVTDLDKVDAMGISPDGKELCMLITDHLDWEDEYVHLSILQDKINAYLAYLENEDWKKQYPGAYQCICFQINFLYEITENCQKFLQSVQDQIGQYGIRIKAVVMDDAFRKEMDQAMSKENQTQEDTSPTENQQPKKRGFSFFGKRDK